MTDEQCAAILEDFRKLDLGPELSAALDHAIRELRQLAIFPRRRAVSGAQAIDLAMA